MFSLAAFTTAATTAVTTAATSVTTVTIVVIVATATSATTSVTTSITATSVSTAAICFMLALMAGRESAGRESAGLTQLFPTLHSCFIFSKGSIPHLLLPFNPPSYYSNYYFS